MNRRNPPWAWHGGVLARPRPGTAAIEESTRRCCEGALVEATDPRSLVRSAGSFISMRLITTKIALVGGSSEGVGTAR